MNSLEPVFWHMWAPGWIRLSTVSKVVIGQVGDVEVGTSRGMWFYCFTLHTHTSHSVHSSKAYNVIVVFKMSKSDDDPTPEEITWVRCRQCIRGRGHNSPYCHHIVTTNIGLMQVREYVYEYTSHSHHTCTSHNIQIHMWIIKIGVYNFGDRSWSYNRLLSELPSMSTRDIVLLFLGQHVLWSFCGYKSKSKYGTVVSRYEGGRKKRWDRG